MSVLPVEERTIHQTTQVLFAISIEKLPSKRRGFDIFPDPQLPLLATTSSFPTLILPFQRESFFENHQAKVVADLEKILSEKVVADLEKKRFSRLPLQDDQRDSS